MATCTAPGMGGEMHRGRWGVVVSPRILGSQVARFLVQAVASPPLTLSFESRVNFRVLGVWKMG